MSSKWLTTSGSLAVKVVHFFDVPKKAEMKSFQKPLVKLELFLKFQIRVLPKRDHFYQYFAKDSSILTPLKPRIRGFKTLFTPSG